MLVDIKKQLETSSFRVKGVDLHPTEPFLVSSLFSGTIQIWNYETQQLIRSIDASSAPIRAVRYIARKNWIVAGGDDMQIRVFNASTAEKLAQFDAHQDYIRYLCVHPTLPIVLSASDDMLLKAWDWSKNWECVQVFSGHSSYVLGCAINPKEPSQFASASMDRTFKVWNLDSPEPNYTVQAHDDRGVNYVEYYPFADKPYILTTSDDCSIRIFDYQSKTTVATLVDHTHNVSFACWHPELPLIISGSEDSTLKLWNARSYKLEQTLNFGMNRAWCISTKPHSNMIAVGYETGTLALRIGRDEPIVSMDNNGKLVWIKQLEAYSSAVKGANPEDGEVHLSVKDLGSVEMQPSKVSHSPDGKYVAVVGDGDYIVYTALAWRNKHFGTALDVCWSNDSDFAVLDLSNNLVVKRNFKDIFSIKVQGATKLFGGMYLGVATQDAVAFFDWETGAQIAVIGVMAVDVEWAPAGDLVAIVTDDSAYVLRVDNDFILAGIEKGNCDLESAFSEVTELNKEPTRSVSWIGDCLVYVTASHRLNYLIGTVTYNISHYDHRMYILRYISRDGAIYLCDKDMHVVSQQLSVSVLEFQTAVARGDVDFAVQELLPNVPKTERTTVARFLESEGYKELALETTEDENQKFELALALGKTDLARQSLSASDTSKWRQLGDSLLGSWDVDGAIKAYEAANELDSLLLIYTSTGDREGLAKLAAEAESLGRYNLAFNALWGAGDILKAADLLNKTGRHSEAALFCLTYGVPTDESVKQWKSSLKESGRESIADRIQDLNVSKPAETNAAAETEQTTSNSTPDANYNPNPEDETETADQDHTTTTNTTTITSSTETTQEEPATDSQTEPESTETPDESNADK